MTRDEPQVLQGTGQVELRRQLRRRCRPTKTQIPLQGAHIRSFSVVLGRQSTRYGFDVLNGERTHVTPASAGHPFVDPSTHVFAIAEAVFQYCANADVSEA